MMMGADHDQIVDVVLWPALGIADMVDMLAGHAAELALIPGPQPGRHAETAPGRAVQVGPIGGLAGGRHQSSSKPPKPAASSASR